MRSTVRRCSQPSSTTVAGPEEPAYDSMSVIEVFAHGVSLSLISRAEPVFASRRSVGCPAERPGLLQICLVSSWAILEGQITIVLESTPHEKTGATGACALEARVRRMTFDESGLCADPSKMPEMPQILVRNRPTRA
jgi:hypothetical protein